MKTEVIKNKASNGGSEGFSSRIEANHSPYRGKHIKTENLNRNLMALLSDNQMGASYYETT